MAAGWGDPAEVPGWADRSRPLAPAGGGPLLGFVFEPGTDRDLVWPTRAERFVSLEVRLFLAGGRRVARSEVFAAPREASSMVISSNSSVTVLAGGTLGSV